MILATKIVLGTGAAFTAVAEVAVLQVGSTTMIDSTPVWVAAIGMAGLTITTIFAYIGQRMSAREQRQAVLDIANEQRVTAAVNLQRVVEGNEEVRAVKHIVNSRTDKLDARIASLEQQNAALQLQIGRMLGAPESTVAIVPAPVEAPVEAVITPPVELTVADPRVVPVTSKKKKGKGKATE